MDAPQNVVREKFRSQCLQRAAKARERAVSRSRLNSGQSSDGFDMECEVETDEDDEAVMQDEARQRSLTLQRTTKKIGSQ